MKNEVEILGKCESCGKDVFSNEDYVEILKYIFPIYYCEECFGGQVGRSISK